MIGMWMWIALGGFAGAISRYAVIRFISVRFSTGFPYGTLAVNVLGSFLLGIMLGLNLREQNKYMYAAFGIGYLGSFTTFSTYAVEGLQMTQQKHWAKFGLYQAATYGMCVAAAGAGFLCGSSLLHY